MRYADNDNFVSMLSKCVACCMTWLCQYKLLYLLRICV